MSAAFRACASARCTAARAAAVAYSWPWMCRCVSVDLRVERLDVRPALLDRKLVGPRVDEEQEIALLHGLVVDRVELDDPARDFRDDVDDVGHHGRVVGLWMPHDARDDHDGQHEAPAMMAMLSSLPRARIARHPPNRTSQLAKIRSAARQG